MKRYIVTVKLETIGTVSAATYAEVGTKAAKLVNKDKGARGLAGIRVTGDQDKS